jgi:hypothetical protein
MNNNTAGGNWQVQIQGYTSDLEYLARFFTALPTRIVKDEQYGFLYESASFADCSTSQEVLAVADPVLAVLAGALKIERNSPEPLRSTGAVHRRNTAGGRDVTVPLKGVRARFEVGDLTAVATGSQGNATTRPRPPPRTVLLEQLATSDPAVAKALRLTASVDSNTWVSLYRTYEVIEKDVGGEHALAQRAWGAVHDLKRFKHSANSVASAGDDARHGGETQ